MNKKLLSILAFLLAMILCAPVMAQNASLVRNGDFEKFDESDKFPDYWDFHSYEAEYKENYGNASAFCEQDAERGSVLHITVKEDDDAAVYQAIRVEPLSIYRISCFIRTENVENGGGANVALRDIIACSEGVYGTSGWQEVTLIGKTGPDQTSIVVSCRLGGYSAVSHGDAWFDDFRVEKLDSAEGDIVPFYSGDSGEKDDEEETKEKSSALPIILIVLAVAVIAAGIIFISKGKKDDGKPSGSKNDPKGKNAKDDSPDKERSFFDCRSNTLPGPTDTKLHFKKRDWIYMGALTLVYGIVAIFRLGTLNFPTNSWSANIGDSVRIEFGRSVKISQIWQNSGVSHINYTLTTDNGEEIAMSKKARSEYGNMYRWAKLNSSDINKATETTGVTLTVIGGDTGRKKDPDLVLNEMVFFDEDGNMIECTVSDTAAEALFDEQKTVPDYPSYFYGMYFDELYHGRTAYEHINNMTVYEWTHPPLGKLIIAIGILIFGMKPFGWRIMGTLFGIAMVPVMYCFGKRLLKRSELALFSAFIFAFDFMHFTQTRISTVDVYGVFFILLMTYFMYKFISMDIGDPVGKMFKPLALSGIFFGLGCASKWICMYTGVALALFFFIKLIIMGVKSYRLNKIKQYAKDDLVKKYWRKTALLCCWCVIFFVVVPAVIYSLSYFRYYTAQWKPARQAQIYTRNADAYDSADDVKLSLSDAVDTYVKGVIKNQKDMYNYHSGLKSDHSAASPWWMWLGNLRPTWFYAGGYGNPNGYVGTISSFGNPAVWVFCNIATVILIIVLIFKKKKFPLEPYFIFLCLASSLLPWVLVPRSTYAYHFFASVPYITLAAGYLIGYWEDKAANDPKKSFVPKIKYIWMALVLLLFIVFYPVISGLEVPSEYVSALQWVPFHKIQLVDSEGEVLKTYRIGWRFLDYEPSEDYQKLHHMITIIQK
ncbi:MAG: glycosyltransferase family 39 protein [Clostridiales bacterium]|nr:glycosyltransferase family 39 protein [Clostridiales bacterium]